MSEIFSDDWMQHFLAAWNRDPELVGGLEALGFSASIGYGFLNSDDPSGVLRVEGGRGVAAGAYQGESLDWDIRSSQEQWQQWLGKPPGMLALGVAFTGGKLKILKGDYSAMLKDGRSAAPFIRSFAVMGRF